MWSFTILKPSEGRLRFIRPFSTDRTLSNCWGARVLDILCENLAFSCTYIRMDRCLPGCISSVLRPYVSYPPYEYQHWLLFIYQAKVVLTFFRCRRDINEHLHSDAHLDQGELLRLFVLGSIDALVILPLGVTTLVLTFRTEPIGIFWRRWTPEATLSTVQVVLASSWTPSIWDNFGVRWDQWINVLFSLIFFFLFGLNSRKKERYRRLFRKLCRFCGRHPRPDPTLSEPWFHEGTIEKSTGDGVTTISSQDVTTSTGQSFCETIHISSPNVSTSIDRSRTWSLRRSQYNIPWVETHELCSQILTAYQRSRKILQETPRLKRKPHDLSNKSI